MTKQSMEVFLHYVKELAQQANAPVSDYCTVSLDIVIQDGHIFEIQVAGRGKIRPEKE